MTGLLFDWRCAIRDDRTLRPMTKLVAYTLAGHMAADGSNCHPGVSRLMAETGLKDRAVRHHIHVLIDGGWLAHLGGGTLPAPGESRRAMELYPRIPGLRHRDAVVTMADYGTKRRATTAPTRRPGGTTEVERLSGRETRPQAGSGCSTCSGDGFVFADEADPRSAMVPCDCRSSRAGAGHV